MNHLSIPEQANVRYLHDAYWDTPQPDWAGCLKRGDCILDVPAVPEAVWGDGPDILWAKGQALNIFAPDGAGKTTVAGNLARERLGAGTGYVLGQPVKPGERNLLYLAMDRPQQAKASLARMFSEKDRDVLRDRLVIWEGPPPMDMGANTGLLADMCRHADADTCIVDSLKDAALKLSDEDGGAGWNRARQQAIVNGTELLELHHTRKIQAGSTPGLEDMYGSRWIAAGAGTVILLWGNPGDPIIRFTHLKQAVNELGPWNMLIDRSGEISIQGAVDLLHQVKLTGAQGMTARAAAVLLFGDSDPNFKPGKNEIEKARGRLVTLEKKGLLMSRRTDLEAARWFLAA